MGGGRAQSRSFAREACGADLSIFPRRLDSRLTALGATIRGCAFCVEGDNHAS